MRRKNKSSADASVRRKAEDVRANWETSPYYADAEKDMAWQWDQYIWPNIKDLDFSRTLELAPGHGRNTERLLEHCGEIHLVDANKTCIEACRERFGNRKGISYHVNDGCSLPMIESGTITLVYSWDAMVHFDKAFMRPYIHEFARVLAPGGCGFVHYSNYGASAEDPNTKWTDNPSWRGHMSRDLFHEYCAEVSLVVDREQFIQWEHDFDLDCICVFRKPAA